jgi:SAM-dependent methyltransferase
MQRQDSLHADRSRAQSFGSVALEYDRYRPGCPEALVADLAESRPERVLDIGCGTGRAAVALAGRGLSVLGVEVDERMAEVARGHGVTVEVGPFETWQEGGRTFDLVTCADAWHWIEPHAGAAKVARLLRPGGVFARFWVYHRLADDVLAVLDAVYARVAPDQGHGPGHSRTALAKIADIHDPVAEHPAFSGAEPRIYPWEQTLTGDDWTRLLGTYSTHQRLGPERLAALQQGLREAIASLGGTVHSHGEAFLLLAHRV